MLFLEEENVGVFYYIARFVGGFYYILFLVMCQHNLYKDIVVGKLEPS